MSFVREKEIGGNRYLYLVTSRREGLAVKQTSKYLCPVPKGDKVKVSDVCYSKVNGKWKQVEEQV